MFVDGLVQVVILDGTVHAMIDGVGAKVNDLLHRVHHGFINTLWTEVFGTRPHTVDGAASLHLL